MKEVIIYNRNQTTTLTFLTEPEREEMKKAIQNCINLPLEYPLINYSDKEDDVLFTAEYLKESLIKFPKKDHVKREIPSNA